ncbi:MAG TPA: VWA domain-containing protein [Lysobacter sp.]|jgi:Ca-activated chloride channel family protein|nr:VWA domain-containing protein [Lysobacter sp.]
MNVSEFLKDLGALHFLRPWWFGTLLALPLLAWWWRARQRSRGVWHGLVDPHLLPHLLQTSGGDRRSRLTLWFAILIYVLSVLALAGPSWRQSAQPLWQSRTPLVIALDLSSAALAADLPPSRLAQARAKLAVLLRERNSGQIGLVVFAGDAFTVTPLTDDAANVAVFLDSLQPDVMPVDGQRADRAITWSTQLLKRAGVDGAGEGGGDIVLLTDHADSAAITAAAATARMGHRVSVLGLGSETGAAYRRAGGEIVDARLDAASLRKLAASGNGRYAEITGDDADLRALQLLEPGSTGTTSKGEGGRAWKDEGYWLLPPLMLFALFAFRRRSGAFAVLLLCAWLPLHPVHAADLWKRPDQAAYTQLQRGNAAYRKGDFTGAAKLYEAIDSATADYNRGNALAKAGQYPQAIAAYNEALRQQPRMEDALANRRAVEAAMKRKPPSGSTQQSQQQSQQQKSQGSQGGQSTPQQGQGQQQRSPAKQDSQSPQQGQQQQPKQSTSQQSPQQPAAPDAHAQEQADRAQRERMQRALQQAKAQSEKNQQPKARVDETPEQRERRLANEAWLKRVPDDPGGLLRAKFRLEYERRMLQGRPEE